MKKHLKKLRPLLLLTALFMLTNCQEDFDEHSHGDASQEASGMKIVRKSFKDFKDLPDLMDKTISRERLRKTNDSTDIYNFDIDSTDVMQVTTDTGTYYTMAITRNFAYPVEGMFENLVISDTPTSKDALIISYKPDAEYYESEEHHSLPAFKGGFSITKIDYKALQKDALTICITVNVMYCNQGDPEGHPVYGRCSDPSAQYAVPITRCTTFIRDSPIFTGVSKYRYLFIQPGLSGEGTVGSGSGTEQDPWTNAPGTGGPPAPGQEGIGVGGPIKPGLNGPVTGPINPSKQAHEDNCKELANMIANAKVKASLQNLENTAVDTDEDGYSYSDDKDPKILEKDPKSQVLVKVPSGGLIYGASHDHPNSATTDYMPMFSVSDMNMLAILAARNQVFPKKYDKFVFTLTVQTSPSTTETFALKIENWPQFITTFCNPYAGMTIDERKKYGNKLQRQYSRSTTNGTDGYLRILFNFMKNEGISGVSVYKAEDDYTKWKKLNYDNESETIKETPCPPKK